MTKGLPSFTTAAQEFVVPRSIPITGPVGLEGRACGRSSGSSPTSAAGCGCGAPGARVGLGSGGGAGRRESWCDEGGGTPGAVFAPVMRGAGGAGGVAAGSRAGGAEEAGAWGEGGAGRAAAGGQAGETPGPPRSGAP